jgi:hypothetical protein
LFGFVFGFIELGQFTSNNKRHNEKICILLAVAYALNTVSPPSNVNKHLPKQWIDSALDAINHNIEILVLANCTDNPFFTGTVMSRKQVKIFKDLATALKYVNTLRTNLTSSTGGVCWHWRNKPERTFIHHFSVYSVFLSTDHLTVKFRDGCEEFLEEKTFLKIGGPGDLVDYKSLLDRYPGLV